MTFTFDNKTSSLHSLFIVEYEPDKTGVEYMRMV